TLNNNGTITGIAGSTGSGGALLMRNAQLTIDDTVVNNTNRISDTQVITMNQSAIQFNANSGIGSTEKVGVVNLNSGLNQFRESIIVTGLAAAFTASNLVRANNSTVIFQTSSATLGGAATNAAQFLFTQINGATPSSSLVGGGGAAASKTVSILPWAVGLSTPV